MTEKRFQYIRGKYSHGVHDTVKDGRHKKGYKTTYDEFDLDKLTDELNIRENKIKQLEKENEQLKLDNKRLLSDYTDVCNDNIAVGNENEQLKNKIDVLEDDNETYHKSLEKLNLYTKRFIPTRCTNEFKDCKTNRYYWLDHEGNFEGCLELLNLLDCENELLKSENRQLKAKLMLYEEEMKGDVE